jgi:hypothetical protein
MKGHEGLAVSVFKNFFFSRFSRRLGCAPSLPLQVLVKLELLFLKRVVR